MQYLRLLFWLKWKLLWRGYRRSTAAAVGAILGILVFLPFALLIAVGCGFGFVHLSPPNDEQLLRGVLLAIYLFWVMSPLLGYALSDSYDITKLLPYPITVRQLFTGAILGSLVDFPVLLLLPTLIAVLVGFTAGPAALLLILPAVALFLFHTLSLSQSIILATAGVLRSRRFRDFATVLIPLFWLAYYVLQRSLFVGMIHVDWTLFLHSRAWEMVNYLPPGLAARSIGAAERGEIGRAFAFLLALLACTSGTVYLAGWLIERVYAGEGPQLRRGRHRRKEQRNAGRRDAPARVGVSADRSTAPSLAISRLPAVVEAVADKEFKYLVRDPYFKIALMNLVYMLFVAAFAFLRPVQGTGFRQIGPEVVWSATGFVLLTEMQLLFNSFGTEGAAAATLFMFPSPRRQILMGKNGAIFAALTAVNLVVVLILTALAGALPYFGPVFVWMELAVLVFIAVGNLTSIWFPVRVVLRGWRIRQQSASRGCAYGAIYLAAMAAASVLLLPVLVAMLLPAFWVSVAWYALAIPLAALYAAGLYALSLHLAAPLLLEREPILIARLTAEE